jgi:hypothetical protein
MGDVALLGPRKVDRFTDPFPALVEELERLLAEAKSGTLRAAAWAIVRTDGMSPDAEVATGWAQAGSTNFALSAAIARLTHRWDQHEHSA